MATARPASSTGGEGGRLQARPRRISTPTRPRLPRRARRRGLQDRPADGFQAVRFRVSGAGTAAGAWWRRADSNRRGHPGKSKAGWGVGATVVGDLPGTPARGRRFPPSGAGRRIRRLCGFGGPWWRRADSNRRGHPGKSKAGWGVGATVVGDLPGTPARGRRFPPSGAGRRIRRLCGFGGPWWRRADSNRRPPRCERGALPAELRPHARHDSTTPASGVRGPWGVLWNPEGGSHAGGRSPSTGL